MATPFFIETNQLLDVQHVLVLKSLFLVHIPVLGVKDLWISGVDYVLNNMSILVHLGFIFVINSLFNSHLLELLFVLLPSLPVLLHDVLLPNLVISLAHLLLLLGLEPLETLQLHELNILERAGRWLFHFVNDHFGQNRVGPGDGLSLLFVFEQAVSLLQMLGELHRRIDLADLLDPARCGDIDRPLQS